MANHLAFPNPLLPVTRREAREPYASDDKAEADDRDRIYSRNQPKAFAASKRLQHSLGVYNDEIWPNPEPCCLIGSQIVEINRNKLLAALSECGEVGPCLDQSTVCIQKENPHDKDARASSVANKTGLRKTTAIGPPQEATSDPEFSPVNGPLTESLCQASDLRVTPVSNLTFENIDTAMTAPERSRQILIRHLEIGVEGVEAIVQGQAYFGHEINQSRSAPSSDDASLQQIAARNATRSLIDSCACQSVTWTFFGILFGQWVEEGNQIPSHWICLGVPEKATDTRIFAQRVDGATDGQLGGEHGDVPPLHAAQAPTIRTLFRLSKGGIGPIDYENLELGISDFVGGLETAMASFSLQISFLTRAPFERQPDCGTLTEPHQKDKMISRKKTRKPSPLTREQPMNALSTTQSNEKPKKSVGYRVAKTVLNDKKSDSTKRKIS